MTPRVTDDERARFEEWARTASWTTQRRRGSAGPTTRLFVCGVYTDPYMDGALVGWLAARADLAEARAELERLRPIVEAAVRAQEAWDVWDASDLAADPKDAREWQEKHDASIRTERASRDGAGREGC